MKSQYNKKSYLGKVLGLAIVGILLLAGCSAGNTGTDTDVKNVGILQLVDHGSLDAAREGFIAGLAEQGLVDGENIKVTYMNAQGDQANLKSMSEKLVKENDVVYAIATPSAQALLNETTTVPIVFAAVTDPIDAGLVKSLEAPGANVTGVTDKVEVAKQIGLLQKINPEIKKVGMIYNPGEANSSQQIIEAEAALKALNIEVIKTTVTTTNDIQSAMESLAKQVEAVYIPTDNTLASGMVTVGTIAKDMQLPVIPGSGEMALDGGLVTYGVDYTGSGMQAAKIVHEILTENKAAGEIAVVSPEDLDLVINEDMAATLGIDPKTLQ